MTEAACSACSTTPWPLGCFNLAQGAGRVDHVVDDDHIAAIDIANEIHLIDGVGARALLPNIVKHDAGDEINSDGACLPHARSVP